MSFHAEALTRYCEPELGASLQLWHDQQLKECCVPAQSQKHSSSDTPEAAAEGTAKQAQQIGEVTHMDGHSAELKAQEVA